MSEPYGLQDLPGGDSDEIIMHLPPSQSVIAVVHGQSPRRVARIVLWEDAAGLHAACLDIDARPLKRMKRRPPT